MEKKEVLKQISLINDVNNEIKNDLITLIKNEKYNQARLLVEEKFKKIYKKEYVILNKIEDLLIELINKQYEKKQIK